MFVHLVCLLTLVISVKEPTVVITGRESKIKTFEITRITSQKQLTKTWAAHSGMMPNHFDFKLTPAITVDFSTHEVIAIFCGPVIDSDSLSPVRMLRMAGSNLLIYQQSPYTEYAGTIESNPYAIIVIPRIKGEIKVIEQIATPLGANEYEYKYKVRALLSEKK